MNMIEKLNSESQELQMLQKVFDLDSLPIIEDFIKTCNKFNESSLCKNVYALILIAERTTISPILIGLTLKKWEAEIPNFDFKVFLEKALKDMVRTEGDNK